MNKNINYYRILSVSKDCTSKDIKKSYRELSKTHHPEMGGDIDTFNVILEAYEVLIDDEKKSSYDKLSEYGKNYDKYSELLSDDILSSYGNFNHENHKKAKDEEQLNIVYYADDNFNGKITYNRYVICKTCNGTGKDFESKLEIRDNDGNIKATFDGYDGCDFCEGTGKDFNTKKECRFCFGAGKIGETQCSTCNGDKRMLGKQSLNGIKLNTDELHTVVKFMGNVSKHIPGKVGNLIIIKKETS